MDVIIATEDFSAQEYYESLRQAAPQAGAIVMFVGLVRDFVGESASESKTAPSVDYLELEHYPGMTEALCQEIIDQARERFALDAVRVVHRVGKVTASEQIVLVAVASTHRVRAFEGAEFIMDYLKTRATFWKKEVGADGANWLGMKQADHDAALRWEKTDVQPS